ncbi:tbc1 domain family member 14 [Diaporthe eres]|uniref:Rab-GAP TBC domain-containing protein n=1 Tax=Diaporthe vaccinii TaxID=105482 RepID=A0ABR4DXY2_9PEZI|nr:tbc1 domain family member 14 [Diaporthe eres]
MMIYERPVVEEPAALSGSGSPPGLTTSKSSKSSSFHSSFSDRESVLTDVSNFEDIGLDDDAPHFDRDMQQPKRDPSPYDASYASDLRAKSMTSLSKPQQQQRSLSKPRSPQVSQREITTKKRRPSAPALQPHNLRSNVRSTNTSQLLSESYITSQPRSNNGRPNSRPSVPASKGSRTPSPNMRQLRPSLSIKPSPSNMTLRPRRGSWQSTRERKTEAELERECDEDDGDDIPEGVVLDNVPLSPRPHSERTMSRPASKSNSPERSPKPRVRSVGNGTPATGGESGSIGALRSPSWKSDTALSSLKSPLSEGMPSPHLTRASSWNVTLAALNKEAQELTEKLEEHAEELEVKSQRSSTGSIPKARRASTTEVSRPKHKSALAELPPLRRSNVMIDPLPISKEKEAVLSRTRPSWLPPKDPAEERRHLKEYQKMMQRSAENERRREEQKKTMSKNKDTAADSIMQIWENEIVPRWNDSIRERRTRELWWRGVASRSRGVVWTKAIGNDLSLSEKSFEAALARAQEAEAREKAGHGSPEDHKVVGWMRTIRKDVEAQTWRDLKIFQAGGPLHQSLLDVLSAYAMYRSDIGYVTGCNTIAALLLLNLPSPTAAFIALANILNRSLPLSFYSDDQGAKSSAYNLLLQTLTTKSPTLHAHLTALADHDADAYLGDIFTSLFTGHVALDEAARLWDVYVFEGDSVLVRAGVAVLLEHEMALLSTKNMDEVKTAICGKKQKLVGKPGDEDRWMKSVREAGKHNS